MHSRIGQFLTTITLLAVLCLACTGPEQATSQGNELPPGEDPPPPPPVGVDEPVFNASSHTSLWYDDFGSYDNVDGTGVSMTGGSGAHRWSWRGGDGATVSVHKSGGVNGLGYVQVDYTDHSQNPNLSPTDAPDNGADPDVLIMTWWLRNRGSGSYRGKHMYLYPSGSGTRRMVISWAMTPGSPLTTVTRAYWDSNYPFAPQDPNNTPPVGGQLGTLHLTINNDGAEAIANFPQQEQHWYNPNAGYADLNDWDHWHDNTWHRLTVRWTKESGAVAGDNADGRLEWWYDGVKIGDWIGDDPDRPEYGAVPMPGQSQRLAINFSMTGPSAPSGLWGSRTSTVDYGPLRFFAPN